CAASILNVPHKAPSPSNAVARQSEQMARGAPRIGERLSQACRRCVRDAVLTPGHKHASVDASQLHRTKLGRTAGAGRVELWWGIGTCAVDITCSNPYPVSLERPAGDARIELGGPGSLRFLRWLETAAENAVVRSTKKH